MRWLWAGTFRVTTHPSESILSLAWMPCPRTTDESGQGLSLTVGRHGFYLYFPCRAERRAVAGT